MIEIKERLINTIKASNDADLLEDFFEILNEDKNQVFELSSEQVKSVEKSLIEYSKGDFYTQEEIEKKMDEWLKE